MRRIILLSAFSLSIYSAMAQVQTQIIGDSVRIHGNTGKGELILQNSTDSVKGFLFNKGAGRTAFQHGLIKINDSLYLIGADTLHLNNFGGLENIGSVYYVSKKYTGSGRAVITGFTLASISSSNTGYTSQLSKAVPGSMVFSYPDPYAARNAAMDAMAAGKISYAEIVVLEGSKYTVGSNDSTLNGNLSGTAPNSGVSADIGFSQAVLAPDSSISSIMKNKINTYFAEGSGFTYINSSYNIFCYYNRDTAQFVSGIYGLGSFYEVYGEVNGFVASFGLMYNPNSITDFHAHEVILQEYSGFIMNSFRTANITIDNLASSETNVFLVGEPGVLKDTSGSRANVPHMLNISVKNIKFGKGQSGYPDSQDLWYFISLSNNAYIEGTQVKIDIGNLFMNCANVGDLFYIGSGTLHYNTTLTVNIDNLVDRDSHIASFGESGGLIFCYGPGLSINNTITFNIKSGNVDASMLGMYSFASDTANKNNHLYIHAGDIQRNRSAFSGGLFNVCAIGPQTYGEALYIKIDGNFISNDSNALIYAFNAWYNFPFPCRYEFSGKFQSNVNGIPVVHFYANTGKIVALTDALLINDGVANSITADPVCNGLDCNCCNGSGPIVIPLYIKNVRANGPVASNITQIGESVNIDTDLLSFFK